MCYQQDLNAAHILDGSRFDELSQRTMRAIAALIEKHKNGHLPLLDIPAMTDDLDTMQAAIQKFNHKNVFILGTGGSSLGGRSLCDLKQSPFAHKQTERRVYFIDNIDPHTIDLILNTCSFAETGFIVISKSGTTAETLCQFLVILQRALEAIEPAELPQHFLVITEPNPTPLRTLATQYGMTILDHPENIGGRFSVLTVVGLLPALWLGLDIKAVRQGAQDVIDDFFENGIASLPAMGALFAVDMMEKNLPMTVMMPYCDRLQSFALWYRQLWAESIGKQGKGSTPLIALGTVDQHSQLQLFLEGPKDKAYTLLLQNHWGHGQAIAPTIIKDEALYYFAGRTVGDLMAAEQQATWQTLINNQCPTRVIHIDELDESMMGGLFMHFMLETIIAAEILDINAFDQPAVEESKVLTRKYLMNRPQP